MKAGGTKLPRPQGLAGMFQMLSQLMTYAMKSPSTLNSSFPQSIASQPKKSVQQAPPEALASKVRKGNVVGGEHKGKEDYKVIWVHQVGMENRG